MTSHASPSTVMPTWESSDFDLRFRSRELQNTLVNYNFASSGYRVESTDFSAQLQYREVNDWQLADARYDGVKVSQAAKDDPLNLEDGLYLVLVNRGQINVQIDDREWAIGEGDFFICPSEVDAASRLATVGETHLHAIALPARGLIPTHVWQRYDNLLAFTQPKGIGAVLSSHVRSVFEQLPHLNESALAALVRPTQELIVSAANINENAVKLSKADAALVGIKHYISKHIKEANLTPTRIAEQHCISTRYLHILFKGEGISVSEWIKKERIEGCRADIARSLYTHVAVCDIAYAWGFNDLSTFYRLFKQATGVTPGEHKKSLQH